MDNINKKTVESWLQKAKDDLNWTAANLREKVYYGACFTAHQTVEKALKAFLISKKKSVAKIHDLSALIEQCKEVDSEFFPFVAKIIPLTDYYIETRYPDMGDFMEYSKDKAESAFEVAKEVLEFVKKRIFVI